MNGDVRYTAANMNLPNYYENFQGLAGTTRVASVYGRCKRKAGRDGCRLWHRLASRRRHSPLKISLRSRMSTSLERQTMTSLTTRGDAGDGQQ